MFQAFSLLLCAKCGVEVVQRAFTRSLQNLRGVIKRFSPVAERSGETSSKASPQAPFRSLTTCLREVYKICYLPWAVIDSRRRVCGGEEQ